MWVEPRRRRSGTASRSCSACSSSCRVETRLPVVELRVVDFGLLVLVFEALLVDKVDEAAATGRREELSGGGGGGGGGGGDTLMLCRPTIYRFALFLG